MQVSRVWLLVAVGVCCLLPLKHASARGCSAQWTFETSSLQEARRRIKSPVHRTVWSRVECGTDVLDALASQEGPAKDCRPCKHEYIQLLRDVTRYMRLSAEETRAKEGRLAYYKLEIETRLKLGEFLVETGDQKLIDDYWSDNFEGMGDAMDRANLGKEFHQEALRNRTRVLNDKSFSTWAKAIRSCQSWDFRQGENTDRIKLERALLCADECRQALTKIRERANSGQGMDSRAISDVLDTLLPALKQCPTGGSS